jgi:hypothetical protein
MIFHSFKHRRLPVAVAALVLGATALFGYLERPLSGQIPGTSTATTNQVLGTMMNTDPLTLFSPNDPDIADPANSDPATDDPPHFPEGGKFKLFGTAADRLDPMNRFNQVISFDTHDPNAIAGALKLFGDHVKVNMLTDQLELKYYYVGRTCGGGSTRVQLAISVDGDNRAEGNAFGYIGDKPFGGGCLPNMWVYEDMTDNAPKWDLSQFVPVPACDMTCTWTQVVAYFTTTYPNHRVLNYVLVDDSQSFFFADQGCAYFDLVSAGGRTLSDWDDTAGGNNANNSCP